MSQTKKTLHAVLGVAQDADADTIAQAYAAHKQRIADEPHSVENDNQLKFIEHAYETLRDPARRRRYERKLQEEILAAATVAEVADEPPRMSLLMIAGLTLGAAFAIWAVTHLVRSSSLPSSYMPRAGAQSSANVRMMVPGAVQTELSDAAIFAKVSSAIVIVLGEDGGSGHENEGSLGSGVVIAPGQVVTNCHVTAEFKSLHVRYHDQQLDASARYIDRGHDLCLLDVPQLDAPAVTVATLDTVAVGDRVVALGTPRGLELTLTDGVVSALRKVPDGKIIQTSAPISPGSSGGGLFDRYGRLIGITTFQLLAGQNLNFAVPADWIAQLEKRNGNQDKLLPDNDAPETTEPDATANVARYITGHWDCTVSNGNTRSMTLDFGGSGNFTLFRRNNDGKTFNAAGSYKVLGPESLLLNSPDIGSVGVRLVDFTLRHTQLEFGFNGDRVVADCTHA